MQDDVLGALAVHIRCLECQGSVYVEFVAPRAGYPELGDDGWVRCESCGQRYPIIAGTVRMLDDEGQARLAASYPDAAIELSGGGAPVSGAAQSVSRRTAESFAYEWGHFGDPRSEWRKNFDDYMQPHAAGSLSGQLILDVGAGSGRHSAQAARSGASVVAIDVGRSIDVTRRNVPPEVLTLQADAQNLPLARDAFDMVMSIGVLHHLANTAEAVSGLVPFVRPGGHLHIYLYWQPEIPWHRTVLRAVTAARRVTTRMPFWLLHNLCYPLSVLLWLGFVLPHRLLRLNPRTANLAEALPLGTYADYPFGVLVNDQFDRFSAPIEQRFTRDEVWSLLQSAGLKEIQVIANHGWLGDGRRPADGASAPALSAAGTS
jgi:SAM-dependent methyltransferase